MRNPVYILSKGRPHCATARTLIDIGYPAEVTIVCGDDDETIQDYVDNFGEERIVVFDKDEWWSRCDMMDAYGRSKASGISPVRNFIIELARKQGHDRCWELDDDFVKFCMLDSKGRSHKITDGQRLYDELDKVEDFGRMVGIPIVGIAMNEPVWKLPIRMSYEVSSIHNVDTSTDMLYRARIFEDAVRMFDFMRTGIIEARFNHIHGVTEEPWHGALDNINNGNRGGMHEQYVDVSGERGKLDGVAVRNVGYTTMALPMACILAMEGNAYVKRYRDRRYRPKIIREQYAKGR